MAILILIATILIPPLGVAAGLRQGLGGRELDADAEAAELAGRGLRGRVEAQPKAVVEADRVAVGTDAEGVPEPGRRRRAAELDAVQ